MPDPVDPDPLRDTFVALNELSRNLPRLQQLAAAALHALATEANQHDSHRTTASGTATSRGTSEHTRVEAAVLNRNGHDPDDRRPCPITETWALFDYVITARDATRHAIRTAITNINRTTPNPPYLTPLEKRRLYCSEQGCSDYGMHEGRCERHHIEHQQQQRARATTRQRLWRHRHRDPST